MEIALRRSRAPARVVGRAFLPGLRRRVRALGQDGRREHAEQRRRDAPGRPNATRWRSDPALELFIDHQSQSPVDAQILSEVVVHDWA